jgi:hypothetical protein
MSNAAKRETTEKAEAPATVLHGAVVGRTPQVPENASPTADIRLRPTEEQVNLADGLAGEVGGQKTWRDDFGKRAPTSDELAASLLRAKSLRDEKARAEAWLAWLEREQAVAWQQALELTGRLQEHFDLADRADPNIALRYPKLKTFLGARADIAARGAETRKKNRAAKKPA